MCDKQVSQIHFFLQFDQEIDNLSLNGYIQCGNRFIQYKKFRFNSECSCDSDSLSLTTGKFVNKTVCMFFV